MEFNENKNEDMSMEDILSSIRKYVSEEENRKSDSNSTISSQEHFYAKPIHNEDQPYLNKKEPDVIELNQNDLAPIQNDEVLLQSETQTREPTFKTSYSKPFEKLTDALKTYGKSNNQLDKFNNVYPTLDKFLADLAKPIIEKWLSENLQKLTEDIIAKEIEKLKSA